LQLREYRLKELEILIRAKLEEIEEAETQLDDFDDADSYELFDNLENLHSELPELWLELESLDPERAEALKAENDEPIPKLTELESQIQEDRLKELEILIRAKLEEIEEAKPQLDDFDDADSYELFYDLDLDIEEWDVELVDLWAEFEILDPERAEALKEKLDNMPKFTELELQPKFTELELQLKEDFQSLKSSRDKWFVIAIFAIFLLLLLLFR